VDHEVPNPAVKKATTELKRLRNVAQKLRAALGRALVLDTHKLPGIGDHQAQTAAETTLIADRHSGNTGRTQQVPPTTRAALIAQLQTLEVQLEETKSHLRSLPARVLLSSLGPLPQTPQLETKLIADAVKVAAYNAQSWLADRLASHYLNTNDRYDLLRSFAHLSGMLIRQADGGLKVCLQPPDLPLQRRALAGLCADLNVGRPVFPGTDIPVHYEVADAKPAARRHKND
jgi:hypothetical protein